MIYTENTKKAMKLAYNYHHGQLDKSGIPYIYHPIHVAEQMKDENTTIVALLHDLLEDCNITLKELEQYDFPIEDVNALQILNHDKKEDYFLYIKRIATNEIARKVKIEDLKHNLDITRLNDLSLKDQERLEKYKKSLNYLINYKDNS